MKLTGVTGLLRVEETKFTNVYGQYTHHELPVGRVANVTMLIE